MSDTKTYKIDAIVAVDPRWVKHMIPSIEDEYEFEEDEELVSYNITPMGYGIERLEMIVRVWPSSMKFEQDSIYLALTTGMEFEDHGDEGVLQWNKKEVPSKTDKKKSRKIALSFSDTEVGTDEYGFIPRIDGEDPDDEDDRYQAYLKKQGINAVVAAGDIFLRENKMKIKLSELKQIIQEELQTLTEEEDFDGDTGAPLTQKGRELCAKQPACREEHMSEKGKGKPVAQTAASKKASTERFNHAKKLGKLYFDFKKTLAEVPEKAYMGKQIKQEADRFEGFMLSFIGEYQAGR